MTSTNELTAKCHQIIEDAKARHKDVQIYAPVLRWSEFMALTEALEAAQKRIAELEESHAGIHSRDHYKRVADEGIRSLAEDRTLTVKLPEEKDSPQGWKVDPEFISKVQDEIGYDEECQCWEGTPSMEMVEAVLIAAAGIQLKMEE